MDKSFTSKQKEIVARKMGYDGPMQGFDDFLASSPSDAQKYSAITSKFVERMAKGGVVSKSPVRKYAPGGDVSAAEPVFGPDGTRYNSRAEAEAAGVTNYSFRPPGYTTEGGTNAPIAVYGPDGKMYNSRAEAEAAGVTNSTMTPPGYKPPAGYSTDNITTTDAKPVAPIAPRYTAAQTATPTAAAADEAGDTTDATVTKVADTDVKTVTTPTAITADTITADTAQTKVETALDNLSAQTGTVSKEAQAVAATQEPTTTAVSNVEAAQGTAATVAPVADRVLQEGELISGSAVDMAEVDTTLAKTKAEQGTVTEESTVQGQLNKLTRDFDAGNPPPWAASSMRTATAQLAARGLGASSMAGQAIIQATLEAALPIATADAKVYETMNLQNLSNRQAVAIELGKQRAIFLGQQFDQNFETRVKNAARIADIADKNFSADVQIALENAQLANTMNIANLSAKNAVVLEKAAAMSRLEVQNLNNRQQVAVENAKAFLAMDIKNLDNKQQVAIFKAQEVSDAIISDTAAANAAKATNAANKLEADKINETLALTASQYNAAERNKMSLANMNAANELAKFNAQERNNREEFNSRLTSEINIANAKILADVSTANTAATNAANAVNAKNATDLSASAYAQQSQTYRDLLSYSWKTGESAKDRITNLAIASIQKDVENIKADSASSTALGRFATEIAKNTTLADIEKGYNWLKNL